MPSRVRLVALGALTACLLTGTTLGSPVAHAAATTPAPLLPDAWGSNLDGVDGNSTPVAANTLASVANVPAGTVLSQLTAGGGTAAAIDSTGTLSLWGDNTYGQYGQGTTGKGSSTPESPAWPNGTPVVTDVSLSSDTTMALTSAGTVYAWGKPTMGAADPDYASLAPVVVSGLPQGDPVAAVTAGNDSTYYALTRSGTVYSFGYGDGSLGSGMDDPPFPTFHDAPAAVTFPNGARIASVVAGGNSNLIALGTDGAVYTWGDNGQGEVGNGTTGGLQETPVQVSLPAGDPAVAVAAGDGYDLASTTSGKVYSWGADADALGQGATQSSPSPAAVTLPAGDLAAAPASAYPASARTPVLTAGYGTSAVVTRGGAVDAWGSQTLEAVGVSTTMNQPSPVRSFVPTGHFATSVVMGGDVTFATVQQLTPVVTFPHPVVAGADADPVVRLTRPDGSTDTGYTGTVGISTTGHGTRPPATYTFTAADQGAHTFSLTDTVAEAITVTATDSTDPVATGTSPPTTVAPGPLAVVTLSPATATTTAGKATRYTATGADAYGNSRGDITATSTFSGTGGITCSGNSCSSTVATPNIPDTVTATDGGVSGTASLTVTAGPATHVALSPTTSAVIAGTPVSYTASGQDQYGNANGDITAATTFTVPGGTCQANVCTVTTAGTATVTGTDGPVTATATETVSPGPLDHLGVAAGAAPLTAGAPTAFTATGYDAYSNPLGDLTASTTFTVTGGSCTGATCTTDVAGPATVTGNDAGHAGSLAVTVAPAALDHLAVSAGPAHQGAPVAISVNGFDRFGNGLGDITATTSLTISPEGHCTAASCTAVQRGAHTVTATVPSPGGTLPTATGSVTFTVGYPVPSITSVTLHVGDSSATATYKVDVHGALPLVIAFTASAPGHPTVTAHSGSSAGAVTMTHLVDGVRYTFSFTVSASLGAGSTTAAIGSGTPARVPAVSVKLSHGTLRRGATLTITGTLTLGRQALGNRVVTLTAQAPHRTVVTLARARTDGHGRFHFTTRPTTSQSYTVTATSGPANHLTVSRNKPAGVRIL